MAHVSPFKVLTSLVIALCRLKKSGLQSCRSLISEALFRLCLSWKPAGRVSKSLSLIALTLPWHQANLVGYLTVQCRRAYAVRSAMLLYLLTLAWDKCLVKCPCSAVSWGLARFLGTWKLHFGSCPVHRQVVLGSTGMAEPRSESSEHVLRPTTSSVSAEACRRQQKAACPLPVEQP